MSKLRVNCFAISVDGFGAGPRQSLDDPLGVGGVKLHDWMFPTRSFRAMHGDEGGASSEGTTGIDDDFVRRGADKLGAWIMGRNMFGPVRGAWPDDQWRGWWGENPPYHVPVFVLTHHPRKSLEMEGGTTFHFVNESIDEVLKKAKRAAGSRDVRLGGGVSTVRQYLQAGLVDEMHLVQSPLLLGQGEPLLSGLDLVALGYRVSEHVPSALATHVVLSRARR